MNATKPRTWVKDDNYYRCDSLAIVKVGSQWRIFNHVKTNDVGNYVGKLVAWRPTLKEAKERAGWAGLADMNGADVPYPIK